MQTAGMEQSVRHQPAVLRTIFRLPGPLACCLIGFRKRRPCRDVRRPIAIALAELNMKPTVLPGQDAFRTILFVGGDLDARINGKLARLLTGLHPKRGPKRTISGVRNRTARSITTR